MQEPLNEDEMAIGDMYSPIAASLPPDAAAAFEEKWNMAQYKALLEHVFTHTAISEQSRAIYRAHVLEDGDVNEVAHRFGVTPKVVRQVKSRINRMIAALVKRLD